MILNGMLFRRREFKSGLVTDERFYAQNQAIVFEFPPYAIKFNFIFIFKHLPETDTGLVESFHLSINSAIDRVNALIHG